MLNFYPQKVFELFEKISAIPHGSFNTAGIADFLEGFAKERKLEFYRDNTNNVVIYKPGSKGKETCEPVILQGHTDMVCASEGEYDFISDGISLDTDGKYVFAKGTTLGADNGIAVAMMLSLLGSDSELPPLECVFTSDEEVGMLGAIALDMSRLKGKRMINVDSEVEGVFTIGCAGGVSCNISYPVRRHIVSAQCYRLEISGLHGGHSGVEINSGYANAIKVAADFIAQTSKEHHLELIDISGGAADNAIPKYVVCTFTAEGDECTDELRKIADDIINSVKASYNDPEVSCSLTSLGVSEVSAVILDDSDNIVALIDSLPNGVLEYEPQLENTVRTSCNIGVIGLDEDKFTLRISLRSSVNSERDSLASSIESTASLLGADVESYGGYPAWEPVENSPLCAKAADVYKAMYGKEPVIEVIHAGLECSIFSDRISDFDCISIGPNLIGIHTPEEKMDIDSVGRVYDYICKVLKNI